MGCHCAAAGHLDVVKLLVRGRLYQSEQASPGQRAGAPRLFSGLAHPRNTHNAKHNVFVAPRLCRAKRQSNNQIDQINLVIYNDVTRHNKSNQLRRGALSRLGWVGGGRGRRRGAALPQQLMQASQEISDVVGARGSPFCVLLCAR